MPTIYLMRHGQAETRAPSDETRQLTSYGQDYTEQIATQLADVLGKRKTTIATVFHSPYQRAIATARIIENKLKVALATAGMTADKGPRLKELTSATPDSNPQDCFEELSAFTSQSFLLVSHMPLIASLASIIEHGNVYQSHPFETSEIRIYECEHWIVGGASFKSRLL